MSSDLRPEVHFRHFVRFPVVTRSNTLFAVRQTQFQCLRMTQQWRLGDGARAVLHAPAESHGCRCSIVDVCSTHSLSRFIARRGQNVNTKDAPLQAGDAASLKWWRRRLRRQFSIRVAIAAATFREIYGAERCQRGDAGRKVVGWLPWWSSQSCWRSVRQTTNLVSWLSDVQQQQLQQQQRCCNFCAYATY